MLGIVLVLIIGAMCSCVSQVEQQQALTNTVSSTLLHYFVTMVAGGQCVACTYPAPNFIHTVSQATELCGHKSQNACALDACIAPRAKVSDYLGSRVFICATRSLTLSLIAADTVVRPGLLGRGIAKLILLPAI
eukprot:4523-Heterococcus_DN1.PRE.5